VISEVLDVCWNAVNAVQRENLHHSSQDPPCGTLIGHPDNPAVPSGDRPGRYEVSCADAVVAWTYSAWAERAGAGVWLRCDVGDRGCGRFAGVR